MTILTYSVSMSLNGTLVFAFYEKHGGEVHRTFVLPVQDGPGKGIFLGEAQKAD